MPVIHTPAGTARRMHQECECMHLPCCVVLLAPWRRVLVIAPLVSTRLPLTSTRQHAPLLPDVSCRCAAVCAQMLALMPRTNHTCRSLVARWLIAFCRASKWYIREDEPLAKELTPWLEPNELKQLVRAVGLVSNRGYT